MLKRGRYLAVIAGYRRVLQGINQSIAGYIARYPKSKHCRVSLDWGRIRAAAGVLVPLILVPYTRTLLILLPLILSTQYWYYVYYILIFFLLCEIFEIV